MPPPDIDNTIKKRQGQEVIHIKKMGRPTDNPRPNKLSIRLSDEDKQILEGYCICEGVNRTEAISRGIKMLKATKESME